MNLTAAEILAGPDGLVVIYIDDVLIASPHEGFAKKVYEFLNSVVPTKIIGNIHPSKGVNLSLWIGLSKDYLVN